MIILSSFQGGAYKRVGLFLIPRKTHYQTEFDNFSNSQKINKLISHDSPQRTKRQSGKVQAYEIGGHAVNQTQIQNFSM